MKRIIAFVMALIISIFIMMNNCYRAFATAVPVTVLGTLIEACVELLVGSGTVTQSEVNKMSATDIFDATKSALPSIDLEADAKRKVEFMKKFNEFINDSVKNQVNDISDLIGGGGIQEFILDHMLYLPTTVPALNGYGAFIKCTYANNPDSYDIYFCEYAVVRDASKLTGTGVFGCFGDILLRTHNKYGDSDKETSADYGSKGYIASREYSEITFGGDIRYADGTPATDITITFDEVPEKIGTVDVGDNTYDVNGDGTVNIGDDTYTVNDDGSITIDGVPYYPDYDLNPYPDEAIDDLLTDILDNIQVIEEDGTEDLVDEAEIDVPLDIANSELSSLTLPKTIATVFPFCIPWDFYNGIKLFSQTPKAPRFEVPFEIPQFGLFPGFKKMIVLDFSDYDSAFSVVRWVTFSLFMFGLCFITFKIVKGA